MNNKRITADELEEYEFQKCNRCLFEKAPDEFGGTKNGRMLQQNSV